MEEPFKPLLFSIRDWIHITSTPGTRVIYTSKYHIINIVEIMKLESKARAN